MPLRERLPQLRGEPFITDGGLETVLIFDYGLELRDFAAFVLLDDPDGREALRFYYESYLAIARERGAGIVLDTPTWRANADWGSAWGIRRTPWPTSTGAPWLSWTSCGTKKPSSSSSAAASGRAGTAIEWVQP